jgi:hypothetical protein
MKWRYSQKYSAALPIDRARVAQRKAVPILK